MAEKENSNGNIKEVLFDIYSSHRRLIITLGTIAGTIGLIYASGKIFRIVATTTNHFKDMKAAIKRKP